MLDKLLTVPNLIVLAVMAWSAVMMRNSALKSRKSRNRDPSKELKTEIHARQRTAESQFRQMEVRLLDYDRDVSARVETTMQMLDQLIADADREIIRLETLLEEQKPKAAPKIDPGQRRMVVHLAGAGYSIEEIARLIDRPPASVRQWLDEDHPPEQRAA